MSITPLSDSPRAPKLVPHFEPAEIVQILADHELFQVVIESPDNGATSHLVGPFLDEVAAEDWLNRFVQKHDYDHDFIRVSSLWELTAPDSIELDEFYS